MATEETTFSVQRRDRCHSHGLTRTSSDCSLEKSPNRKRRRSDVVSECWEWEVDDSIMSVVDVAEGSNTLTKTVSVLFDVDGCAVTFTLALLTNQAASGSLYVISYCEEKGGYIHEGSTWDGAEDGVCGKGVDVGSEDSGVAIAHDGRCWLGNSISNERPAGTRVRFCLLNQACTGLLSESEKLHEDSDSGSITKARIRAAFVCDFPSYGPDAEALNMALDHGEPLDIQLLRRNLNDDETFALHDERNTVLSVFFSCTSQSSRKQTSGDVAKQKLTIPTTNLLSIAESFQRGRRGLTQLYIRHEQKTIAAYRRVYGGSSTTPFWYVSKFGPLEKTLVLCTRYYLMQAAKYPACADYDLQAIKDVCITYDVPVPSNKSGLVQQDLTSFAKLSKFCCESGYAKGPVSAWFPKYVSLRVQADLCEVRALEGFIERDRGGLRVSDGEFVKYVYLAHFECYNRRQIRRHLNAVTATEVGDNPLEKSTLGTSAVEGFFTHIRSQLNIADYVSTHVTLSTVDLPESLATAFTHARSYDPMSINADSTNVEAKWGCSSRMVHLLDETEDMLTKRGWPRTGGVAAENCGPGCNGLVQSTQSTQINMKYRQGPVIVRRLLAIAAAEPPPQIQSVAGTMTRATRKVSGPLPVYRSSGSRGKQLFGISASEHWSSIITCPDKKKLATLVKESGIHNRFTQTCSIDELASTDVVLTLSLIASGPLIDRGPAYRPSSASKVRTLLTGPLSDTISDQERYINRNEVFNNNLLVGHMVLDVDMHVRGPVPYRNLHVAMRGFRKGIITALRLLFSNADVDWDSHPCYFYKSDCSVRSNRLCSTTPSASAYLNRMGEWEHEDYVTEQPELYGIFNHAPIDEGWEDAYGEDDAYDDVSDKAPGCRSIHQGITYQDSQMNTTSNHIGACSCRDKIGFRVSVPLPTPYVLHGAVVANSIARVIQQAILLERSFVEPLGEYLRDYNIIDTGVYGHGRSLRMPFFAKIQSDGTESHRLLPFVVMPEKCDDPTNFITAHFSPATLHMHSLPANNSSPSIVVTGMGGEYVSYFEKKTEFNRTEFFGPKMSLAEELRKRGIDIDKDATALEAFVTNVVLDEIESHVTAHFPDHAAEYHGVSAICRVTKGDWVLFQLVPGSSFTIAASNVSSAKWRGTERSTFRGASALVRTKGFTCVRYKHRRPAGDTVRSYLSLSVDAHGRLCASLGQQCFATKCGNNKLRTLFTVTIA
nr:helicase-primase primase subunit UL52 [Psittacid alphaherpesvirus 6]